LELGDNGRVNIHFPIGSAEPGKINQHCFNNGVVLTHLLMKKKSLEAKFLEMTNE